MMKPFIWVLLLRGAHSFIPFHINIQKTQLTRCYAGFWDQCVDWLQGNDTSDDSSTSNTEEFDFSLALPVPPTWNEFVSICRGEFPFSFQFDIEEIPNADLFQETYEENQAFHSYFGDYQNFVEQTTSSLCSPSISFGEIPNEYFDDTPTISHYIDMESSAAVQQDEDKDEELDWDSFVKVCLPQKTVASSDFLEKSSEIMEKVLESEYDSLRGNKPSEKGSDSDPASSIVSEISPTTHVNVDIPETRKGKSLVNDRGAVFEARYKTENEEHEIETSTQTLTLERPFDDEAEESLTIKSFRSNEAPQPPVSSTSSTAYSSDSSSFLMNTPEYDEYSYKEQDGSGGTNQGNNFESGWGMGDAGSSDAYNLENFQNDDMSQEDSLSRQEYFEENFQDDVYSFDGFAVEDDTNLDISPSPYSKGPPPFRPEKYAPPGHAPPPKEKKAPSWMSKSTVPGDQNQYQKPKTRSSSRRDSVQSVEVPSDLSYEPTYSKVEPLNNGEEFTGFYLDGQPIDGNSGPNPYSNGPPPFRPERFAPPGHAPPPKEKKVPSWMANRDASRNSQDSLPFPTPAPIEYEPPFSGGPSIYGASRPNTSRDISTGRPTSGVPEFSTQKFAPPGHAPLSREKQKPSWISSGNSKGAGYSSQTFQDGNLGHSGFEQYSNIPYQEFGALESQSEASYDSYTANENIGMSSGSSPYSTGPPPFRPERFAPPGHAPPPKEKKMPSWMASRQNIQSGLPTDESASVHRATQTSSFGSSRAGDSDSNDFSEYMKTRKSKRFISKNTEASRVDADEYADYTKDRRAAAAASLFGNKDRKREVLSPHSPSRTTSNHRNTNTSRGQDHGPVSSQDGGQNTTPRYSQSPESHMPNPSVSHRTDPPRTAQRMEGVKQQMPVVKNDIWTQDPSANTKRVQRSNPPSNQGTRPVQVKIPSHKEDTETNGPAVPGTTKSARQAASVSSRPDLKLKSVSPNTGGSLHTSLSQKAQLNAAPVVPKRKQVSSSLASDQILRPGVNTQRTAPVDSPSDDNNKHAFATSATIAEKYKRENENDYSGSESTVNKPWRDFGSFLGQTGPHQRRNTGKTNSPPPESSKDSDNTSIPEEKESFSQEERITKVKKFMDDYW